MLDAINESESSDDTLEDLISNMAQTYPDFRPSDFSREFTSVMKREPTINEIDTFLKYQKEERICAQNRNLQRSANEQQRSASEQQQLFFRLTSSSIVPPTSSSPFIYPSSLSSQPPPLFQHQQPAQPPLPPLIISHTTRISKIRCASAFLYALVGIALNVFSIVWSVHYRPFNCLWPLLLIAGIVLLGCAFASCAGGVGPLSLTNTVIVVFTFVCTTSFVGLSIVCVVMNTVQFNYIDAAYKYNFIDTEFYMDGFRLINYLTDEYNVTRVLSYVAVVLTFFVFLVSVGNFSTHVDKSYCRVVVAVLPVIIQGTIALWVFSSLSLLRNATAPPFHEVLDYSMTFDAALCVGSLILALVGLMCHISTACREGPPPAPGGKLSGRIGYTCKRCCWAPAVYALFCCFALIPIFGGGFNISDPRPSSIVEDCANALLVHKQPSSYDYSDVFSCRSIAESAWKYCNATDQMPRPDINGLYNLTGVVQEWMDAAGGGIVDIRIAATFLTAIAGLFLPVFYIFGFGFFFCFCKP